MEIVEDLKKQIKDIKEKGWIKCDYKNCGAAGLKLEKILGINPDNFEIPDYNGIEIKTKKSLSKEKITLFCATPDSYLFENKRLYDLYGYPDKYDAERKMLNTSISTLSNTYINKDTYFRLYVNREKNLLQLLIYKNNKLIDSQTSWTYDLLKEKLERKLTKMCYIEVDSYFKNGQLYIKYKNDKYYKLKDFNTFIDLLEKGFISVSLRMGTFKSGKRKGQLHDHGTGFCIDKNDLSLLFYDI